MSRRLHAARYDEALRALEHVLGWWGGFMEVHAWVPESGRWEVSWIRCGTRETGRRLVRRVRVLDERVSAEVRLSLPRAMVSGGTVRASALWARVEGDKQRAALDRFRPEPTVVIQEGTTSRAVAFWQLDRLLRWEWLVRANKRIAHRLGTPKKWASPDDFLFPAPGSCLRYDAERSEGRARPVPVLCTRLEPVHYTARDVVGRLRDAPDPEAWRERAAT